LILAIARASHSACCILPNMCPQHVAHYCGTADSGVAGPWHRFGRRLGRLPHTINTKVCAPSTPRCVHHQHQGVHRATHESHHNISHGAHLLTLSKLVTQTTTYHTEHTSLPTGGHSLQEARSHGQPKRRASHCGSLKGSNTQQTNQVQKPLSQC
jgi:hypothetical protein